MTAASPHCRRAFTSFTCGLALCAIASGFAAPASRAAPADDFNRARNAFTFGNYQEAIRLFTALLNPLKLREENQLVEARQLLGISHYFVRNYFAAQEEFERLLYLRPRHELDALLFPPPVIDFFEKVRERIKDKLGKLHPELQKAPASATLLVRHVERRPWVLNLVPFGVGQLQNRRVGKAIFFAAAQLATLTTNLITYGLAEARRLPDGRFNAGDESFVRGLRTTQIASLATFGALVIAGIVDGFVDWQPEVVREERLPLPGSSPAPRPPASPSPAAPRKGAGLSFGPFATAGGAGLSLGFRF